MSTIVKTDLATAFEEAWHAAAPSSADGHRVEAGISAILEHLELMDGDILAATRPNYQGVTIWVGDNLPLYVDDDMSPGDLREMIGKGITRAVLVARLSAIVEILDADDDEVTA